MKLSSRLSLTQQNALLLVAFFLAFELLVASAVSYFLMLPMARRSAADLAGLMALSAQTWSELPPVTRPAFEIELARSHDAGAAAPNRRRTPKPPSWRSPTCSFLVEALSARAGRARGSFARGDRGRGMVLGVAACRRGRLSVGFPHSRIGPRPIHALLVSLAGGALLTLLAAWWLARRATRPLQRLQVGGDLAGARADAGTPARNRPA